MLVGPKLKKKVYWKKKKMKNFWLSIVVWIVLRHQQIKVLKMLFKGTDLLKETTNWNLNVPNKLKSIIVASISDLINSSLTPASFPSATWKQRICLKCTPLVKSESTCLKTWGLYVSGKLKKYDYKSIWKSLD